MSQAGQVAGASIFRACQTGDILRVKHLVSRGVGVNRANSYGCVALHYAVKHAAESAAVAARGGDGAAADQSKVRRDPYMTQPYHTTPTYKRAYGYKYWTLCEQSWPKSEIGGVGGRGGSPYTKPIPVNLEGRKFWVFYTNNGTYYQTGLSPKKRPEPGRGGGG